EGRIHYIQVGIDAEGDGKIERTVGRIAVEEVAVVKVAVRAGCGDRFGQLVDGKIVGFGQHGRFWWLVSSSMTPARERGNAQKAAFLRGNRCCSRAGVCVFSGPLRQRREAKSRLSSAGRARHS